MKSSSARAASAARARTDGRRERRHDSDRLRQRPHHVDAPDDEPTPTAAGSQAPPTPPRHQPRPPARQATASRCAPRTSPAIPQRSNNRPRATPLGPVEVPIAAPPARRGARRPPLPTSGRGASGVHRDGHARADQIHLGSPRRGARHQQPVDRLAREHHHVERLAGRPRAGQRRRRRPDSIAAVCPERIS